MRFARPEVGEYRMSHLLPFARPRWWRARNLWLTIAFVSGCGGRVLGEPSLNGSPPPVTIIDGGEVTITDGSEGNTAPNDGSSDQDVEAQPAPVPSPNAQSAWLNSFAKACVAFSSSIGKTACEKCVNDADRECNGLWTQLREQCPVAYSCGSDCACTAPCSTTNLCACVAGCLPLYDSPCNDLWTQVMQCIGSVCGGSC
jgi:hypothetical protein